MNPPVIAAIMILSITVLLLVAVLLFYVVRSDGLLRSDDEQAAEDTAQAEWVASLKSPPTVKPRHRRRRAPKNPSSKIPKTHPASTTTNCPTRGTAMSKRRLIPKQAKLDVLRGFRGDTTEALFAEMNYRASWLAHHLAKSGTIPQAELDAYGPPLTKPIRRHQQRCERRILKQAA